ncbi:MAG: tetratricopeptide repeat protein [Planctomycetota bacterium]|jgi:tetratricopeptide (TPR) repeat protein
MFDSTEDFDSHHEWDQAERMVLDAFELYEKGQMNQALEKLSDAIEMGPEHGEWYFNMALILDGLEQYEKGIDYYEKALECMDDDVEILNCLGVDYTRTAQYDKALEIFEQIERMDANFEPGYCNRIITYTEMEQYDKAEQMFYLAQQINPDCALCFYNIGNSLFTQGNYEKAIWCWDKCSELDPEHPQIHFRLAQACWVSGNGDRAREEFLTEIRQNPADLDVILDFGLFLLESGDFEAAREKFNRILEFDSEFAPAKFYLGEVKRMQGFMPQAIRLYQSAIELNHNLVGPRFRLAQIFKEKSDIRKSLELLRAELKLEPEDTDVLLSMGWLFLQLGAEGDASGCFLQVLDQDSKNYSPYYGLGMSLAMTGEFTGALQCLKHAIRLDSKRPELLICAGWICYKLEKWKHGLKYVRKCLRLYPDRQPYKTRCKELQRAILYERSCHKVRGIFDRILHRDSDGNLPEEVEHDS